MPKFSANLSFLYLDLPFLDRIDAAAASGFRAVECMSPYEFDSAEIARRLRAGGLEQVLFNLPLGDAAAGERGFASDPSRVEEFRRGVADAVRVAGELGCAKVNCLAGFAVPGLDPRVAHATLVENLRFAAHAFAPHGITLLLEPLNRIDMPGFLVGTTAEGLALLDAVGAANFQLQYDCYHAQRSEGNVIATMRAHISRIGHVQIADSPGRNEPGTGELAYERILPVLDELQYEGWVGLEYKPTTSTQESLSWMRALHLLEVVS